MPSLVKMKLKSGRESWTVRYRKDGKQKTYTIGQCDKRTAERVFKQVCDLLAEGKPLEAEPTRDTTLSSFFEDYITKTGNTKAPPTVQREKKIFENFVSAVGDLPLSEIRPLTVENYRSMRLSQGAAPTTVNLEFRHLKTAFNTAKRWELISKNPLDGVRYIRVPQSEFPRFLSLDEIKRTLDAFAGTDYEPLVRFYLGTGARLKEALTLTWGDIDLERGQVIIKGIHAKGKRNRVIPLKFSAGLLDMLKGMKRRGDGLVFGPRDRKGHELPQWHESWIGHHISKVLSSIGLPWATVHTFRHSFASHLVMAGVPIFTVQRLLGHAQIDTTMVYAHLAEDHSAEAMAKLPY